MGGGPSRRLEKRRAITLAKMHFVPRASEQYCYPLLKQQYCMITCLKCGGTAEKMAFWSGIFYW